MGIYCTDGEHGSRLNEAVQEVIMALIVDKTRLLPPPSKLTHAAKLLFNEQYARCDWCISVQASVQPIAL